MGDENRRPAADDSRVRRLGLLGPLLAVAVALVPTSHARLDTPANERGSRNILLPERGIYLGAFVGGWEENPYENVLAFEALIGRKVQIDNHYYGWPATFPGEWERWDAAHGRIPMATWLSGISLVAGEVRAQADQLKNESRRPVRREAT